MRFEDQGRDGGLAEAERGQESYGAGADYDDALFRLGLGAGG